MPIRISTQSRMPLSEPYSDRPIMDMIFPTLGENVIFTAPRDGEEITSRFRVINIAVDVTQPAPDRALVYVNEAGLERTYVANFSGIHPLVGWGIVSIGAAIDIAGLQVGI